MLKNRHSDWIHFNSKWSSVTKTDQLTNRDKLNSFQSSHLSISTGFYDNDKRNTAEFLTNGLKIEVC